MNATRMNATRMNATRMKGGVMYSDGQWFAIMCVWKNHDFDPERFVHPKGYATQAQAAQHYDITVKPLFTDMIAKGEATHFTIDNIEWR